MLRSLAVLAFIAVVATGALYAAQRKTIARGDVLAADLVAANAATIKAMHCDDEVEVGVAGATFSCRAELQNGLVQTIALTMDRAGAFHAVDHPAPPPATSTSSDPWD